MESMWSFRLRVLVILIQVIWCGSVASEPCSSGFVTDLFRFRVQKAHLQKNTYLGTVYFNDCSGRAQILFESSDERFHVNSDGKVKLKRHLILHNGYKLFTVHAWDSTGKEHSAHVKVENVKAHATLHEDQEAADFVQIDFPSEIPDSEISQKQFPELKEGLKRKKREWVIPTIRIAENSKGPFPFKIAAIKSSYAKETVMEYKIKGEGADLPPVGLFTVKKNTGDLFVAKPLDREAKANYVLQAEAFSTADNIREPAMEIVIEVTDQNDNSPVFTQNPFVGSVPESSKKDFEFMTVNATDLDDSANTYNAEIRYIIIKQTPPLPQPDLFAINPISGVIRVNVEALDRENYPQYTLDILAADLEGEGLRTTGTAVITISDSNDHPPQFEKSSYNVSVPENQVNAVVVKMPVTDRDDANSPAWNAKFRIVDGNSAGCFSVSTAANKQEGIISTVKPLDFENNKKYTLLVVVENEIPLAVPLPYFTATVTVNVLDVNEPPVFDPTEKTITKTENLELNTELVVYTASDPDSERSQKLTYRIGNDPADWLNIDKDTGLIRVKHEMDRESPFVVDGKYKALILAVDNDVVPATGTGTLVIELVDFNDNAPTIDERMIKVCNSQPSSVLLSVTDKDGPQFAAPYTVELMSDSKNNWTAKMNDTKTGIILQLTKQLEQGDYNVALRVYDKELLSQENTIHAQVCDCTGAEVICKDLRAAGFGLPGILGILGAILVLLLLVLLLLLFVRRKKTTKKDPLITDDDTRDNVYYYDEEGGGEDDQDYDLSVLHRGLDNRPEVFRNDVVPTFMPAPQYRPRPANPEEIGTFIDDNLKAADNDPTAPPYDSLLVFDYEGGGSDAGSLSSLNSSSSGDQDYDRLGEWGPRFRKLADMYGGGED